MTQRRWSDPFDDMSDAEFDAHVDKIFSARPRTIGVSLRVPEGLLERVKREAARAGMPYQTFMMEVLDAAVSRLERRPAPSPTGMTVARPRKPRARARRGAA